MKWVAKNRRRKKSNALWVEHLNRWLHRVKYIYIRRIQHIAFTVAFHSYHTHTRVRKYTCVFYTILAYYNGNYFIVTLLFVLPFPLNYIKWTWKQKPFSLVFFFIHFFVNFAIAFIKQMSYSWLHATSKIEFEEKNTVSTTNKLQIYHTKWKFWLFFCLF